MSEGPEDRETRAWEEQGVREEIIPQEAPGVRTQQEAEEAAEVTTDTQGGQVALPEEEEEEERRVHQVLEPTDRSRSPGTAGLSLPYKRMMVHLPIGPRLQQSATETPLALKGCGHPSFTLPKAVTTALSRSQPTLISLRMIFTTLNSW